MNATTLVWHGLTTLCVLGMMQLNANAGSATSVFHVTATLDPDVYDSDNPHELLAITIR